MERARRGSGILSEPRSPSPTSKRNHSKDPDSNSKKPRPSWNGEVDLISAKTVQVDNVPADSSDEALWEAFHPYGHIVACQKQAGANVGYVMFKKNVASKKAEEASKSLQVDGNTVEVSRMSLPIANPPAKAGNNRQQGLLIAPGGQANGPMNGRNFISRASSKESNFGVGNQSDESMADDQPRSKDGKPASYGRQPSSGIYVTRLGDDCTEQTLYSAFARFGRVTDVFLIRDEQKNSRHSAFVDFVDVKSASKAVECRGFEVDGRRVDVKFKHNTLKPENCMSIYVRNVPPATTEASITEAFQQYGAIQGVQVLKDRAVAFVHFDNHEVVEKLVQIGRVQLHGEQVVVRYNTRDSKNETKSKTSRENSNESKESGFKQRPENCTKIYVSHLSTETNEDTLRSIFGKYGELERIFILRELSTGVSKGVAFIDFKTPECADKAVEAANGILIDGRQPVVRYKVVEKPRKAEGCSNTVFAANLAPETTEDTLLDHCQQYGDIESVHLLRDPVTGVSRGKGFIMFKASQSVDRAVAGSGARIDGKVVLFRCVQPAYAQNRREKPVGCVSVFVSNLSKDSTIMSLGQHSRSTERWPTCPSFPAVRHLVAWPLSLSKIRIPLTLRSRRTERWLTAITS
jgi:RNA recognition motif-containing protein